MKDIIINILIGGSIVGGSYLVAQIFPAKVLFIGCITGLSLLFFWGLGFIIRNIK